jgi:hypothetical protein
VIQKSREIRFTASTEGIKRDGRELEVKKWNLENYNLNPVFLWVHDYMGNNLPLGKSKATVEEKRLVADVSFDQADEFARKVEAKYRGGYLNAVSVGWFDVFRCLKCNGRLEYWDTWGLSTFRKKCPNCGEEITEKDVGLEYDLLDISAVPVPGDPEALMERELRAIEELYKGLNKGLKPLVGERGGRPYEKAYVYGDEFEKDSIKRIE